MDLFLERHADKIAGVLSCLDRVVITGTIPGLCFAKGMTSYMYANGIRIFDYPKWAEPLRDEIRQWAEVVKRGIARVKLLQILRSRAEGLGVKVLDRREIADPEELARYADVLVASDGINSITRRKYEEHFLPDVDVRKCRFIWLGTRKLLDAFTFAFKQTEHGWFTLHAYRFDHDTSTFIIETPEDVWLAHGLDRMEQSRSIEFCERLFADLLQGEKLMSNALHLRGAAVWIKFARILCRKWHYRNIVLIGDAAHTAHFSIGSGTKLAMEDAIALAKSLTQEPDAERALASGGTDTAAPTGAVPAPQAPGDPPPGMVKVGPTRSKQPLAQRPKSLEKFDKLVRRPEVERNETLFGPLRSTVSVLFPVPLIEPSVVVFPVTLMFQM